MTSARLAALTLVSLAAPATAAPGVAVTIYNDDLAMVQDSRQLDIRAGRQRLEFKDVSAQIRPETVSLTADGLGIV